jgi:hypothetical protein
MAPTNNVISSFIKSIKVQQPLLESENFITLTFSILVATFSLPLTLLFQSLAGHFESGIWEGNSVNPILNLIPFPIVVILFIIIFLYLLNLFIVIKTLFEDFWESVRGE